MVNVECPPPRSLAQLAPQVRVRQRQPVRELLVGDSSPRVPLRSSRSRRPRSPCSSSRAPSCARVPDGRGRRGSRGRGRPAGSRFPALDVLIGRVAADVGPLLGLVAGRRTRRSSSRRRGARGSAACRRAASRRSPRRTARAARSMVDSTSRPPLLRPSMPRWGRRGDLAAHQVLGDRLEVLEDRARGSP